MKTDIATIINRARRRLGLQHTTMHEADLRQLVNEGLSEMQKLETYTVSCEIIDIECGRGKLPFNCDFVLAISPIPTDTGCCCLCSGEEVLQSTTLMNTRSCSCSAYYVSDSSILMAMNDCGASCSSSTNIYYTQNGYLILKPSAEGQMKVYYWGKNVDCNGIMMADEDDIRGVSAYAAYQFASSGSNFNKYNYRQVKDWEKEWVAQKSYWQGVSQKKYFKANKARFTAIATAIVTNPVLALAPNP